MNINVTITIIGMKRNMDVFYSKNKEAFSFNDIIRCDDIRKRKFIWGSNSDLKDYNILEKTDTKFTIQGVVIDYLPRKWLVKCSSLELNITVGYIYRSLPFIIYGCTLHSNGKYMATKSKEFTADNTDFDNFGIKTDSNLDKWLDYYKIDYMT